MLAAKNYSCCFISSGALLGVELALTVGPARDRVAARRCAPAMRTSDRAEGCLDGTVHWATWGVLSVDR